MGNACDYRAAAQTRRPCPPRWSGYAGAITAGTGGAFIALVVLLQWLRGDLDWIDAQLSAYLHGAYGLLLRTAYCLLAAAMAWLALGLYAALAPVACSRTVMGLFCMAAVGLSAVAIGDSWMPVFRTRRGDDGASVVGEYRISVRNCSDIAAILVFPS